MLRAQLEMSQVRQEIDRRIQEKEEEFEIGPNDRLIGFSFGYYDGRLRGIQFKTARCPNSFVFPIS